MTMGRFLFLKFSGGGSSVMLLGDTIGGEGR